MISTVGCLAALPDELVKAAVDQCPVSVLVDIRTVRAAGRLAIQEHAEGDRVPTSGGQHEVRVACVEPEGDAAASPV